MRNWAKKRCLPALALVLCLLPGSAVTAPTPAATQAVSKASVAPFTTVAASKAPATPVSAAVKPGSGAEIFVRADLQPDGQYKFVGGLTRNLATSSDNAGVRLSVIPMSGKPHMLAPWEWRWVDQTYADMQPVVGYPSVHVTKPLYMAPNVPLDVNLMAIAQDARGNGILPDARMQLMPCQGSMCPRHLEVDLQVYYGIGGVQETLTTQIAAPHSTTLRNGFITYPGGSLLGNNQPQRSFPAYGPVGPSRKTSQIVLPYEVGLYGVDAYSADSTLAKKDYFIPGDAFAFATTDILS